MRRIVDLIAILTIFAIGAAWYMTREDTSVRVQSEIARGEVNRMRAAVLLRSQSDRHSLNAHGWPIAIDPAWFGQDLPMNPMVDADRPWLEVAAREQSGWEHPRPLFVVDQHSAMFWYNPALGIVRSRVALRTTDAETLREYNTVNNTHLGSLDPNDFGDIDSIDLTSIDVSEEP